MRTNTQIKDDRSSTERKPIRTLLLDNDIFDRIRLRRYLTKIDLNFDVVEATSIREMSPLLEKHRFDLILIDHILPEGCGFNAVDQVRANALNATAAVVMVSGAVQNQVADTALRKGCQDYVAKDEMSVRLLRNVFSAALEVARGMPRLTLCEAEQDTTVALQRTTAPTSLLNS